MKARIIKIIIALDIFLFAVITLGGSKRNETMSSAAWSLEQDGKFFGFWRPVIDTILWFDPEHCANSWLKENQ